ncbi:MAG: hypothetical protein RL758_175 [Pseudomonadota bacterium]|jgi:single-strand DNA-binding protein
MASVNKVTVLGNVGQEPEIRYNPSGTAWCTLSIATSYKWTNKEGEKQEETEWHRVVFNGRLAEVVGEYVKKGNPLYVEGRLKTRKWQDKEGRDTYTTEIMASEMQLLGGREEKQPQQPQGRAPAPAPRTHGDRPGGPKNRPQAGGFDDMGDDIPW